MDTPSPPTPTDPDPASRKVVIVDRYAPDGPVDAKALLDAGEPFHGLRLKLCQGTYPPYSEADWCASLVSIILAHPRCGVDFGWGLYDYVDFSQDGVAQMDYAWSLVETHPILQQTKGRFPLMLDVERGGQRQQFLSAQRVIHVTSAMAARYMALSGLRPTLYGCELILALGITDHMGCDRLEVASYTAQLPHQKILAMGWPSVDGWQYCGTDAQEDQFSLADYPRRAPGCSGWSDCTAVTTMPDPLAALKKLGGMPSA
jgi:hypothetical protein